MRKKFSEHKDVMNEFREKQNQKYDTHPSHRIFMNSAGNKFVNSIEPTLIVLRNAENAKNQNLKTINQTRITQKKKTFSINFPNVNLKQSKFPSSLTIRESMA
ncbi:hypothetical protein DMUE_1734 [Dictyocoela muelleri]|nr:hypothetical protein DMUE_1734 [Dictyocoela muelleri]